MARRRKTFENVKFFTKRSLRKYTTDRGVLLDQNQKKLTFTHINDDETSFRRKNENNGLVSTQQLPVDNSLFLFHPPLICIILHLEYPTL